MFQQLEVKGALQVANACGSDFLPIKNRCAFEYFGSMPVDKANLFLDQIPIRPVRLIWQIIDAKLAVRTGIILLNLSVPKRVLLPDWSVSTIRIMGTMLLRMTDEPFGRTR